MSINSQLFFDINGLAHKSSLLDGAMVFCAHYLIYGIFVVTAGLAIYLLYTRQWKTALWLLAALATTFVILKITQHIHPGVRPFVAERGVTQLLQHDVGVSFPSDHTTVAAAIAFAVLFMTRYKLLGWLLLTAAVIVGIARIFVGVHYPFDVAAGLATGAIGALVVYAISRRFTPRPRAVTFDSHTS